MEVRIWDEWNSIMSNPLPNILIGMKNRNIRTWTATLTGPQDTPYYGGLFFLDIEFVEGYPIIPPNIVFRTPIYHPNISEKGEICLDILKKKYSQSLKIGTVLCSLVFLLANPNALDPLNDRAAFVFMENHREFVERARKLTIEQAM